MRTLLIISIAWIGGAVLGWALCRMAWLADKHNDAIIFNEKLKRIRL